MTISAGTQVRVRTTNGGDGIFWLVSDYVSDGYAHVSTVEGVKVGFVVTSDRLRSIHPVAPPEPQKVNSSE